MICYYVPAFTGFLAGIIAGAIMGGASEIAFRRGIFGSSLFVIDGSFLASMIRASARPSMVYLAGIPLHLVTSGVFGTVYTLSTFIIGLPTRSLALVALYVFFLLLSMLCIALPMAGQGFLGKKAGGSAWFEQFLLHVLFFVVYYGGLHIIRPSMFYGFLE